MDPLSAIFDSYKLDDLDRSWINQVNDSGFSNIENVPVNYLIFLESTDTTDLLRDTCSIVKDWISKNHEVRVNDRDEVSWETLIAMNIEVQSLLSVLAYLIKKGQTFDACETSRQSCFRATSLYFVLLAIPGSNAFQAFQPNLYEIALKSLELSQRLIPAEKNYKRCGTNDLDCSANSEEYFEPSSSLTKSQSTNLINGLNAVMYDLVTMLKSTCTTMEIRSVEITVYYLVEMTKLADEPINYRLINKATTSSLAYNAYVALECICNPKYASVQAVTRLIAKYTLPQFLISSVNSRNKRMSIIRESTLYFLKKLLITHEIEARSALNILIQHVMMKCPDRSEGRQKQAAIIIKLFGLCCDDENSLRLCVKDLVHLSHHGKISYRIFAQEIISKFITELSSARNNRGDENFEILSTCKVEEILLACALGRCVDVSSMVRGRAIATLAEFTDSIDRSKVRKLFQTEREEASREIPCLEKLEESIEGKSVDSLLPDTDEVMSMLKNRLEDERALVRRSALQVLRNGVHVSPELLDIAVPIVRQRCRDSVLTVRRYAIRVLTNLLETFPDFPGLCEVWVDSVVPGVFDCETKVQEEVINSLEKLTIGKIRHYNDEEETNNLPWRILDEIAVNKMSDHLSKACCVWTEENRITETKITIVKSHIGSCNNMGAWLLLASISENKTLRNIETYYTCYIRSLIEPEDSDVFLANLALRVIKNNWSSFDDLTLAQISRDLTNFLKNYQIKVALIRQCLDILLEVTRHLEEINGNETEMNQQGTEIIRELVRLSEMTIGRIVESTSGEHSDNLLFRAVCTLGHASFLSWVQISMDSRRILQRFLLEWTSLPDAVRDKKELQGAAVVVLGQQSLIDRDLAVEMTPIFGYLLCTKGTNSIQHNGRVSRKQDDTNEKNYAVSSDKNRGKSDKQDRGVLRKERGDDLNEKNCEISRKKNGDDRNEQNGINVPLRNGNLNDYKNIANSPVVRINAAKALADICVRFTSLVEPYLTNMCISMKDPNPEVRQVILVIFIQLLVEDTIMIKEEFFFHILTMIADDDVTIREMTIFLIKERLLPKNKNLITQQFLNGIYHFNDYKRRTSVVNRRRKIRDRNVLSLAGMKNIEKRRMIYDFMLENLDAPGKLTIIVKLTAHILNPRTNDRLDVQCEKGISIIRDAIYLVSSEYLQINSCSRQTIDDDTVDDTTNVPANSVIVEAMKKHKNEIFLHSLVELKRHCENLKSPIFPDVKKLLIQTIADTSKEALTSLYNEYPKLEQEIQRDSRNISKRAREDSVEDETEGGYCETPKKSNLDRVSLLINSDRMPRIVLRRLSTLTYPGTSGCSTRSTETSLDYFGDADSMKISNFMMKYPTRRS